MNAVDDRARPLTTRQHPACAGTARRPARRRRSARSCLASPNSTASPALDRNASRDRSTIDRPGRQREQLRLDRARVGAVDLALQMRDRHAAHDLHRDHRRPDHPRRSRRSGARPVARADRRPLAAGIDVDGVHQRAHDPEAAPAIPGVGGRRPPAPAIAHDQRQHAAGLTRQRHLDRGVAAGRVGVLDRVRAQLARGQHDELAVARLHPGAREPRPHRLAHHGELIRTRREPQVQRRDERRQRAGDEQRDVVAQAGASRRSASSSSALQSASGLQARARRPPRPRAAPCPTSSGSPRRSIAPSEYRISVANSGNVTTASS